jgi:site-specific recombinase XerD
MNNFTLSICVEGFILECNARRLSPNTIKFYTIILKKLTRFFPGDPFIADIAKADIERFLDSLTTLCKKSLVGHHATLSALWRWAVAEGVAARNVVRDIPQARPEERLVTPFTQAEVKLLLGAVDKSAPYQRPGQRICQHSNPTAQRNHAIIYLLLDTGIRASELCGLAIRDVDLKARHIIVMGKGDKERQIPFDSITGQVIWRYLAGRKTDPVSAPLFPAWIAADRDCPDRRSPLDARDLYHILQRIGRRAGVADVHPHRFRHTFAIQFLRNKGDVYTLQRILGHTTLDMVRCYLAIAQTDIEAAHRLASPVANWRL